MKALLLILALLTAAPVMADSFQKQHYGYGRDRYDMRDRYDVYFRIFRSRWKAEQYCPAGDDVMAYYGRHGHRGFVCVRRTLN